MKRFPFLFIRIGFAFVALQPMLLRAAESPDDAHKLDLVFTGQALIQHDLRKFTPEKIQALMPVLHGHDVVFTDLETAVVTDTGTKTRDSQFFHAAGPEVIDCLKDLGFNLPWPCPS